MTAILVTFQTGDQGICQNVNSGCGGLGLARVTVGAFLVCDDENRAMTMSGRG